MITVWIARDGNKGALQYVLFTVEPKKHKEEMWIGGTHDDPVRIDLPNNIGALLAGKNLKPGECIKVILKGRAMHESADSM